MNQKIILLSLLLVIGSLSSFCQFKSLFGDNSTKYSIFETISDGSEVNEHSSLGIIEDDGYLYHQIQYYLIREDTVTGKVWRRTSLSEEEVLIMDMSLNVGDTMYLSQSNFIDIAYATGNQGYALVQNVFYNEYGKNIELNCHTNNPLLWFYTTEYSIPLKFIEGIGPNYSYCYGFFPLNSYLVCSYKDDTLAFTNTEFNTCDSILFWVVGEAGINEAIKTFPKMECSCYPNSNYSSYSILCPDSFTGNISIYNIHGKTLFSTEINKELSFEVSLKNFESGIYILNFSNNTGYQPLKLIKL